MTKEERIKVLLRLMEDTASPRWAGSGKHAQVRSLQGYLDATERLLQAPESSEDSITRLVITCSELEEECARKDGTITLLKERNDRLGVDLTRTEALLLIANRTVATQHRQLAQAYNQVKGLQRTLEQPLP